MSLVDTRYAEAFIKLAVEKDSLDSYQEDLLAVTDIIQKEEALKAFLFNPENTLSARKSILSGLLKDRVRQDVLNLLLLLLDKGRITSLPGICREYVRLADEKRSILNINIFAAVPIDQAQINKICDKFKEIYNTKNAKADLTIDPSLIGGVKVAIGDKLYDGTVKGRLESLHASLIG
jgi:F-type H+-transporting ATPase subunit delta